MKLRSTVQWAVVALMAVCAEATPAQSDAPRLPELNRAELDRMASHFAQGIAHERAWVAIMQPIDRLYRDLRQRGKPGAEAANTLLRIGLPGADIGPLGELGLQARLAMTQWVNTLVRQDGQTESAAVAQAYLDLNQALARLVTAEKPLMIHFKVVRDSDAPQQLRSERLQPRQGEAMAALVFTELVDAKSGHACTVEAFWHVIDGNTKLVLSCKTKGSAPWRTATVVSDCRGHPNPFRALTLGLQGDDNDVDQRHVHLWCSSAP